MPPFSRSPPCRMALPGTAPTRLLAGDTARWVVPAPVADYPSADGWTWRVQLAGRTVVVGTATPQALDGVVEILFPVTATTQLEPGPHRWGLVVERGAGQALERQTIAGGACAVAPNVLALAPGQAESHAVRMLRAIESVLEGRIPADVEQYAIGGRQITKIPVAELRALRTHYRQEVAARRQRQRGQLGRAVAFTFGPRR